MQNIVYSTDMFRVLILCEHKQTVQVNTSNTAEKTDHAKVVNRTLAMLQLIYTTKSQYLVYSCKVCRGQLMAQGFMRK